MSRIEKLVERLLSEPNDFTWSELVRILTHFGYIEIKKGKTSGSRRKFANKEKHLINLHKPHPGEILKRYQIKDIIEKLKERGFIKNE